MDIQKFIDEYISWLKSEITYSEIGEYCEIPLFWITTMIIYRYTLSKKEMKYILLMMEQR